MARLPRLYAPRIPQLVRVRFARPLAAAGLPAAALLDPVRDWLAQEAGERPLALHAWVIVPGEMDLLATPGDARALPQLLQALGRRMGSGLLRSRVYAGRYHNALLEPGRWVLPAMLWLETLAAATGLVAEPTQWPWCSAARHAGLPDIRTAATGPGGPMPADAAPAAPHHRGILPVLADHPDYWQVGDTPFARQAAWHERLRTGITPGQRQQIETALHGQWALGESIFLAHLARLASRRVQPAARGRPRKARAR